MTKPLVVTSGYGKSKYPAMYLADALSTIGVPAVFLDPLDAEHGGWGRVVAMAEGREVRAYMFSRSGSLEAVKFLNEMRARLNITEYGFWLISENVDIITDKSLRTLHRRAVLKIYENRCDNDNNCPPTDSIVEAMRVAANIVKDYQAKHDPKGEFARSVHPAKTEVLDDSQ